MSTISIATAAEVFDLLKDDLAAIEVEFSRQADSPVAVVTDIANYLIAGGGKRIRPLLLLLSAKSLQCESDARIRVTQLSLSHRRRRPHFEQKACVSVAKCVEAAPWNFERVENRPKAVLHNVIG